jgi:hypothetical protein
LTTHIAYTIKVPTVLRIGPYRFQFFMADAGEPPHVHVFGPNGMCKFWLIEVALAAPSRLQAQEQRNIERLVRDNRDHLLRSWDETFK